MEELLVELEMRSKNEFYHEKEKRDFENESKDQT